MLPIYCVHSVLCPASLLIHGCSVPRSCWAWCHAPLQSFPPSSPRGRGQQMNYFKLKGQLVVLLWNGPPNSSDTVLYPQSDVFLQLPDVRQIRNRGSSANTDCVRLCLSDSGKRRWGQPIDATKAVSLYHIKFNFKTDGHRPLQLEYKQKSHYRWRNLEHTILNKQLQLVLRECSASYYI